MRIVLALVALMLAAPAARAQEASLQPAPTPVPTVSTELAASMSPALAEISTEPVRAEAREVRDAKAAKDDQFAQRGSFWWLVGVIVIAGVLLAVLLD